MRVSAGMTSAAIGAAAALTLATIELTVARAGAPPGAFHLVWRHAFAAIAMEMVIGAGLGAALVTRPPFSRFLFPIGILTFVQWGLWGSRWLLNRHGLGTHLNVRSIAVVVASIVACAALTAFTMRAKSGRRSGLAGLLLIPFAVYTAHWVQTHNESDHHYRANYTLHHPQSAVPPSSNAPPPGARNLLVIVADTLRADALGCYGNPDNPTPVIDRLASRGVRFADVTSTSSWTRPAMATLWTGLSPREHGVNALVGNLDESVETIPERFRAMGYDTFAVVANPILKQHFGFGQGFASFDDRTHATDAAYFMAGYLPAVALGVSQERAMIRSDRAARVVDRFFERLPNDRPFLAWVHFFDPHAPYSPPEAYKKKFVRTPVPHFRYGYDGTDLELTEDRAAFATYRALYDAEVRYLDDQLGRLFVSLIRRGLDRNTVVVFLSDHGEQFREHGGLLHGYSLYQEEVRIPLIVTGPDLPQGAVVNRPISLVDLPGVFEELARVAPKQGSRDWARLTDESATPGALFADVDANLHGIDVALSSVRQGMQKRMVDRNRERTELYDLAVDPGEMFDLTDQRPPWGESLGELQRAFDRDHPRVRREAAELDAASKDALRSLGYIQ
ncbi:MAG: sulfatase [Deltaproteobacteria bacterium]|nr:sulfatase [Deltaproteobacteria bacterium]